MDYNVVTLANNCVLDHKVDLYDSLVYNSDQLHDPVEHYNWYLLDPDSRNLGKNLIDDSVGRNSASSVLNFVEDFVVGHAVVVKLQLLVMSSADHSFGLVHNVMLVKVLG